MRRRIEEHKRARPGTWSTLEVTRDIGRQIKKNIGQARVVVVDCVTLLINNIFCQHLDQAGGQIDASLLEQEVNAEIDELVDCMDNTNASFIVVTNEVGLGLVPDNTMGRLYRDLLGKANQTLAEHASQLYLMVAGLPLPIKPASTNDLV